MTEGKIYSLDALKREIDGHEAISFDIFDTLVMRTVYYNHDVFRLVGDKYKEVGAERFFRARREAERELSVSRYPYMEEIYDLVAQKLGIDKALAYEMMEYEKQVEREVIIPRHEVINCFNYCKQAGKRVYIVSDMYMHRDQLEEIINKIGIVGYDDIFVSCEYDTSKPQHLFDKYLECVKATSYLHIGDSEACDILPSKSLGMDNFRLKTSAELWEANGQLVPENAEERREIAKFISKEYNNPFV